MKKRYFFVFAVFHLAFSIAISAQTTTNVLDSFAHLSIQTTDGRTNSGNGFLISREGVMATALHLVANAKRVTARFSNGETFECSGIVDSDPARNVALIRIKQFGRPRLSGMPQQILSGTQLQAPVFKDDAFGIVTVTTGEAVIYDDRKHMVLTGDIPLGNSGGPIVDKAGSVVGFITMRMVNEKPAAFLMPIEHMLALDATLPTKPFGETDAAAPPPKAPAAPTANTAEDLDILIGKALVAISDNMDVMDWADARKVGVGFRNGVPQPVYDFLQEMEGIAAKLAAAQPSDPLRQKVQRNMLQTLALQKQSSESFIRAVVIGQQTGVWGAQSSDAHNRATSSRKAILALLAEMGQDVGELEKSSAAFKPFVFPDLRYQLKLAERPSGYKFGVINYVRRPYFMLVVYDDGFAHKIGIRPGDTIKSVGGTDLTQSFDIEELKMILKQNLGKKLEAIIERDGKDQHVTLKIPKEIPKEAMY